MSEGRIDQALVEGILDGTITPPPFETVDQRLVPLDDAPPSLIPNGDVEHMRRMIDALLVATNAQIDGLVDDRRVINERIKQLRLDAERLTRMLRAGADPQPRGPRGPRSVPAPRKRRGGGTRGQQTTDQA